MRDNKTNRKYKIKYTNVAFALSILLFIAIGISKGISGKISDEDIDVNSSCSSESSESVEYTQPALTRVDSVCDSSSSESDSSSKRDFTEIPEKEGIKIQEAGNSKFEVSDYEKWLLESIVFAEGGTCEPLEGQIAVASEILNRVESDQFPDTVEEVLLQQGQYYSDYPQWASPEGWRYVEETDITDQVKQAVEFAIEGEDPTEDALGEGGALFHYNPDYTSDPGKLTIANQFKIGQHMFYRTWDGYSGN